MNRCRPVIYEDSICLKVSILIIGAVVLITSAGLFYSWQALALVLEEQGVYKEYCHNSTEMDFECVDRDLAFNRIYTFAIVVDSAGAIIHGTLVDKFGSRVMLFVSSLCFIGGCFLFSVSSYYFDYFSIGAVLIVFGGIGYFYGSFPLFYNMGKHRDLAITVFSSSWDSSVIMVLIYYFVYKKTGWDFRSYFRWQIIPGFVVLILIFFFPRAPTPEDEIEINEEDTLIQNRPKKSFIKSVLSPIYVAFCFYYAFCLLWINLYIGTVYDQLIFIGEDHEIMEFAVEIFSFLFSFTIIMGLVVSVIVKHLGPVKNFILVNSLLFAFTILKLVPNIYVQYVNFGVFLFARAYFFCYAFIWVAQEFPREYYGKMIGITQLFASCVTMSQYWIYLIVKEYLDDRFAMIDLVQAFTLFLNSFFIIAVAFKVRNKRTI